MILDLFTIYLMKSLICKLAFFPWIFQSWLNKIVLSRLGDETRLSCLKCIRTWESHFWLIVIKLCIIIVVLWFEKVWSEKIHQNVFIEHLARHCKIFRKPILTLLIFILFTTEFLSIIFYFIFIWFRFFVFIRVSLGLHNVNKILNLFFLLQYWKYKPEFSSLTLNWMNFYLTSHFLA